MDYGYDLSWNNPLNSIVGSNKEVKKWNTLSLPLVLAACCVHKVFLCVFIVSFALSSGTFSTTNINARFL